MQERATLLSAVAIVLVAVGFVWIGQGMGLLRGSSFMVDDFRWAVAGAVAVAAGATLAWRLFRDRARR